MPTCDVCGGEFSYYEWLGKGSVCIPCQRPPATKDEINYWRAVAEADEDFQRIFPDWTRKP